MASNLGKRSRQRSKLYYGNKKRVTNKISITDTLSDVFMPYIASLDARPSTRKRGSGIHFALHSCSAQSAKFMCIRKVGANQNHLVLLTTCAAHGLIVQQCQHGFHAPRGVKNKSVIQSVLLDSLSHVEGLALRQKKTALCEVLSQRFPFCLRVDSHNSYFILVG